MRRLSVPHVVRRTSGDRWLFGYADVVTLLFACFASLYAARTAPAAEAAPAAASVLRSATPRETVTTAVQPTELEARLATALAGERVLPGVDVAGTNRGLVISLPEAGSFPPGQADFSDQGRRVLLGLAAALRDLPNLIRVEGHTDDVPIRGGLFTSNWELSTARATRVVQFLIDTCGIDPSRLSAAGYAEHRPRVPNDSAEARARNRRVDIVVLDSTAAFEEPGAGIR